jgi:D-glycerate 3-kinase
MPRYSSRFVDRVLAALLARLARRRAPWLVGISGAQASGKSTLAAQLVAHAEACGIPALTLALDDYYLGRGARAALARRVHPLYRTRGAPGTHATASLGATLDALRCWRGPLRVPRFDKGRDTRLPPRRWREVRVAPRLVLLEGWCVGLPAQAAAALRRPLNALEREHDRDGAWRRAVNTALAGDYAALWARLDALLLLKAPDWPTVRRWRAQPERLLRRRADASQAMDARALARFLEHYERLTRHALRVLPARADLVVELDARRVPRRLRRGRAHDGSYTFSSR